MGTEMIEKYIMNNSILEVNIDHKTKTTIIAAASNVYGFEQDLFDSANA